MAIINEATGFPIPGTSYTHVQRSTTMPMPAPDGHTLADWLARVERRVEALEQQASAPSNVVHPISAEHPLVVGDVVRSEEQGSAIVTAFSKSEDPDRPFGVVSTDAQAYLYDAHTGIARAGEMVCDRLTRVAHVPKPGSAPETPTPTRPLQVGDRVRNAAGTDTGVVAEMLDYLDGLWAGVEWRSGYGEHQVYSPGLMKHKRNPDHPEYGHVVLLESPDFDTQARERGYVKAEEVAHQVFQARMRYSGKGLDGEAAVALLKELEDRFRAQAKGGAK